MRPEWIESNMTAPKILPSKQKSVLNIKVKLKLEVASAYIALHSLTIFFLWIGLGKSVFAYNCGFLISYILSVQFSHSVLSDSLRPQGLQHAGLPYPSPTPSAYSNSCPLRWWCHPSISPSVVPFSSHLQSFQASGSFQMSQFLASGGQNIGVSASASFQWIFRTDFLQDWLVGSPFSPRDSQESSPAPLFKSISSLRLRFRYSPTLTSIHDYWENYSFN